MTWMTPIRSAFRARRSSLIALSTLAIVGSVTAIAWSYVPVGSDFRISSAGTDGDVARSAFVSSAAYNSAADEYLVVWAADGLASDEEFEIFGQRLSASGAELGGDFRISTTGPDNDATRGAGLPTVVYNPTADQYLVVWTADGLATDNEFEIFGQRLSSAGAEVGGDFRISSAGPDGDATRVAVDPEVAHNPTSNEYLVVWEADGLATDNELEIFGQRLSAAGAEVGGDDFRISSAGADADPTRDARDPAVDFNPTSGEYLVAWQDDGFSLDGENEIFGQRLGASGTEVGSDFRISTTGTEGDPARDALDPAVVANPTANQFLVTWRGDGHAADDAFDAFGQRLSGGGAPVGAVLQVSNVAANREVDNPTVEYNSTGNEYLVAWTGQGLPASVEYEIFGQRVSSAGVEVGTDFRISNVGDDGVVGRFPDRPAIAPNPTANQYLISWQADGLATDDESEIFGRRLAGDPPPPPPDPDPDPKCGNKIATVVGTAADETLKGTAGPDVVAGLDGNDKIKGLDGNDLLCGGAGKDKLIGGAGKDKLLGESGKDRLSGGAGRDVLKGAAGRDKLAGGGGKDKCIGSGGKDRASGCEKTKSI